MGPGRHVEAQRGAPVLADPVAEDGFGSHVARGFAQHPDPDVGAGEVVRDVAVAGHRGGGDSRGGDDESGDRRCEDPAAAVPARDPERGGARGEDAGEDRGPRPVEPQGAEHQGRRGRPGHPGRPVPSRLPRGHGGQRRREDEHRRRGVEGGEQGPALQQRDTQSRGVGVARDVPGKPHETERPRAGGAGHGHPDESPDEPRVAPAEGARHEQNRESRARLHRRPEGVGGRGSGDAVPDVVSPPHEEIDQPEPRWGREIPGSPDAVIDGARRQHGRPEQAGRREQRRRHGAVRAVPPCAAAGIAGQEGQEDRFREPVLLIQEGLERSVQFVQPGRRRQQRRRVRHRLAGSGRIGQEETERPQRGDDEQPVPGPYRAEEGERRQGQLRRGLQLVRPEHRLERDQRRGQQQDGEGATCHGAGVESSRITESSRVRDRDKDLHGTVNGESNHRHATRSRRS